MRSRSREDPAEATGGVIHCAFGECPTLAHKLAKEGYQLVDVTPATSDAFHAALAEQCAADGGMSASLVVYCANRPRMLIDLATCISEGVDNIGNVNSEDLGNGQSRLQFDLTLQNRTQLERTMEAVREVKDVTDVRRGKDSPPSAG